jgi:broad specificity phosphatase PhoE
LRAVHTAHICAQHLRLPVRIEEGFGERMAAEWFDHRPRTRSPHELKECFDTIEPRYHSAVRPVFPEEYTRTTDRFARTITIVLEQTRGAVLIVGHGATYHGVTAALLKTYFDPQADPASLARLDLIDGLWRLTYSNRACHD